MENHNQSVPALYLNPACVYIRVVGACAFAAIGLPLNAASVWIIYKCGRQGIHDRLLTYMNILEIVLCVVYFPVFAADQLTVTSLGNATLCKGFAAVHDLLHMNPPTALMCITFNRFIKSRASAITRDRFGAKHYGYVISGMNVLKLAILIPPFFDVGGTFGKSALTGTCDFLVTANTFIYNCVIYGCFIAIPSVLMFVCYAMIIRTVRMQNAKIGALSRQTGVLQLPVVQMGLQRRRETLRVIVISAVTVFTYILTLLPFTLGKLIPGLGFNPYYRAVTTVILFSHTITFPIIFTLGDPKLKVTLFRLLGLSHNAPQPQGQVNSRDLELGNIVPANSVSNQVEVRSQVSMFQYVNNPPEGAASVATLTTQGKVNLKGQTRESHHRPINVIHC